MMGWLFLSVLLLLMLLFAVSVFLSSRNKKTEIEDDE
jgi:hypothetical protein